MLHRTAPQPRGQQEGRDQEPSGLQAAGRRGTLRDDNHASHPWVVLDDDPDCVHVYPFGE